MLALICAAAVPRTALSAEKEKGQEISRVIAKEMTAAQKALQASNGPRRSRTWTRRKRSPD